MIGKPVDEFVAKGNRENLRRKLTKAAIEFNQVFQDATRAGVIASVTLNTEEGILQGIDVEIKNEESNNG